MKTCPFCDGPAGQPEHTCKSGSGSTWEIACQWCFVTVNAKTKKDVIRYWQQRKGDCGCVKPASS